MSAPAIEPRRLAERADAATVELVDVRTPVEFREVHADRARNIPLDRLDPAAMPTDRPIFVICKSGSRGRQACEKLRAAGLDAFNVEGGTLAWIECGLPVMRGKKSMSLERQVRIAAGTLVLIGVILGWLVHPAILGLAAFVGAGLVFAGITDTCGMGMLLARMPWNRVAPSECAVNGGAA
jgi:rhodanese-related sulfurtransferase